MNIRHTKRTNQAASPPGLRKELASIIFDSLLDGAPRAQVERQIRRLSIDPAEIATALRRFDSALSSIPSEPYGLGVRL